MLSTRLFECPQRVVLEVREVREVREATDKYAASSSEERVTC